MNIIKIISISLIAFAIQGCSTAPTAAERAAEAQRAEQRLQRDVAQIRAQRAVEEQRRRQAEIDTAKQARVERAVFDARDSRWRAAAVAGCKRKILELLKDPSSAQWGESGGHISSGGAITVTMFVNARNSYGGYTGMRGMTCRMDMTGRNALYLFQ